VHHAKTAGLPSEKRHPHVLKHSLAPISSLAMSISRW
jgi:hypothetical protein